jgi:thymidylate synthase
MNTYDSSEHFFIENMKNLYYNPEFRTKPRGMYIHENINFSGKITNPRDRLIYFPFRKWDIVYGLGEFIWYISGNDSLEMISYYAPSYGRFSDNNINLNGAYGPRIQKNSIYNIEQYENYPIIINNNTPIENVIFKLKSDQDSRQAVILIWREKDMYTNNTKDLPCTINLQFFIRENKLHMITNMRSNDIWLGSTNDIFCFTMIQEFMSSALKIDIGNYYHNVGSLHLYEKEMNKINNNQEILEINEKMSKPMFPIVDLYDNIKYLIEYENIIRLKDSLEFNPNKFIELNNIKLSDNMTDLLWILYYGKMKRVYSNNIKDNIHFNYMIKNINQDCIKEYINLNLNRG